MQIGIPSVRTNHYVAIEVTSRHTEENLAIAGLRMLKADACLVHSLDQVASRQHSSDLFARRHAALQIQPHFHRPRVRIGVGLGMFHRSLWWPRSAFEGYSARSAASGSVDAAR
jgi:hypothetical protein